ncbi:carotenoid isomerooxygenase [Phlebotomus argentipes]|uniref:carotenoid isomerooxygenase n=1 Tax=Phlebotomus argentipes TaxID=94469 RepID=UPI00289307F4|nr:carotenoid isomerooxygenase [Phlebotomus argentipes]
MLKKLICDIKDKKERCPVKPGEELYPNCDASIWTRSCEKEVIEPIQGRTTGSIPKWINGSLLRNGPGNLKFGQTSFKHLFDASALLHRFAIRNGDVTYQCRFIETNSYNRNRAAQRIVVTEFGTKAVPDPCQSIFTRVASIFHPGEVGSDNAMITVYPFGDDLFAFTETPVMFRFDAESLATLERVNMFDRFGIVHHSSHPHVMSDGRIFNLGMTVSGTGPKYTILEFSPGRRQWESAKVAATQATRWKFHPGYMHTFGMSENYFVLVEQPLSVSVRSMLVAHVKNEPMMASFKWFQEHNTHIYLLDRKTGSLKFTFHSDPFFFLHVINTFEKEDHLILDICCYNDPSMLNCMYIDSLQQMQSNPDYAKMFRGRPLRFILPLNPVKSPCQSFMTKAFRKNDRNELKFDKYNLVTLPNTAAKAFLAENQKIYCLPELLCDLGCETPRINYEKYGGKEYRYFYAISSDVDADNPGTIIKVDVMSKTRITWCEDNCYPSEPIFLESPDAKSEDDGVVIASLVWGKGDENHVGLIVLCAKTLEELGRSEFFTPSPVPKCLHGWFTPQK